jgi:hypothetical protein
VSLSPTLLDFIATDGMASVTAALAVCDEWKGGRVMEKRKRQVKMAHYPNDQREHRSNPRSVTKGQ